MASSLVRGRHLICRVRSRTEAEVVDDGAAFQCDGTIVEIGPYRALAAKYQPDEVIGSPEHVVMPGLVNGHHHVGLTPFQLGSPDHPLELWLASRMAARDVDLYLDTLYSAFEMVESGITTVQHLHGWRVAPAARVLAIADRIRRPWLGRGRFSRPGHRGSRRRLGAPEGSTTRRSRLDMPLGRRCFEIRCFGGLSG
jgi:5-methylthioadenosine/S-adenosylhomocysteine deaminase